MENPAATKAQIVKALKAMIRDLTHGEEVTKTQCMASPYNCQICFQICFVLVKFVSQYFFVTDQQDSRGLFCMGLVQRPETRPVHLRETRRWLPDRRGWCSRLPDNGLWQSEHHVQRAPSCGNRAPS